MGWGGLQSNFRVKPNLGCVELLLIWGFDRKKIGFAQLVILAISLLVWVVGLVGPEGMGVKTK